MEIPEGNAISFQLLTRMPGKVAEKGLMPGIRVRG
jgi:hypothetical protein